MLLSRRTGAPLAAVSSAAAGADTLFAEAAAELALPWTLLLPASLENFRVDFTPAEWARTERLLPRAIQTHVEPPGAARRMAFLQCGIRVVEECDVLVAFWNDERGPTPGGTGDVVAYARALGKPLLWIHAGTFALHEENLSALPVSLPAGQAAVAAGATGIAAARQLFDQFSTQAKKHRPLALNLNLSLVVLHQLATLVAVAALLWSDSAHLHEWAPRVKIAVLLFALAVPWLLHHAHATWRDSRAQAEICRSALAFWPAPDAPAIFTALRLPVFLTLQRHLQLLRLLAPGDAASLEDFRAHYVERRLRAQRVHYERQAARATARRRWLRRSAALCTAGAILASAAVMLHLIDPSGSTYTTVKFFGVGLPLAAAALLAAGAALDVERRCSRYREMAAQLGHAEQRALHAPTENGLREVVIDIERRLLLEVLEWHAVTRYAAAH